MKQLIACALFALITVSSLAQSVKPNNKIKTVSADSVKAKAVADSIRDNTPLLSRKQVFDIVAITIEGYKNEKGQYIKSRFETAITKDDHFNGEEYNLIMQYAFNLIANDIRSMMNGIEEQKRKQVTK